MAYWQWYAPGSPQERAAKVVGKAVHPAAFERLFELFPNARVAIRHADYKVELPHGSMKMSWRYYAQPEHETYVIIDTTGEGRPGTGDKAIGLAICHPLDNYDRRKGISLAFDRALDQARKLRDPEGWRRARVLNRTKKQRREDEEAQRDVRP